jgi:hypothetical protein
LPGYFHELGRSVLFSPELREIAGEEMRMQEGNLLLHFYSLRFMIKPYGLMSRF